MVKPTAMQRNRGDTSLMPLQSPTDDNDMESTVRRSGRKRKTTLRAMGVDPSELPQYSQAGDNSSKGKRIRRS